MFNVHDGGVQAAGVEGDEVEGLGGVVWQGRGGDGGGSARGGVRGVVDERGSCWGVEWRREGKMWRMRREAGRKGRRGGGEGVGGFARSGGLGRVLKQAGGGEGWGGLGWVWGGG